MTNVQVMDITSMNSAAIPQKVAENFTTKILNVDFQTFKMLFHQVYHVL